MNWIQKMQGRCFFGWAGVMGAIGALMALGLELYGHFPACRLCHIERALLALSSLFAAATWLTWHRHPQGSRLLGWATVVLWGLTGVVGWYHVGVQFQWWAVPQFCAVQDAHTLDAFLAVPTASCEQRTLDILGIPASLILGVGMGMYAVLGAWCLRVKPRPDGINRG